MAMNTRKKKDIVQNSPEELKTIWVNINLKLNNMPLYNQIFEEFRREQREIEKAIKLLQKHGYVVSSKEKTYASRK